MTAFDLPLLVFLISAAAGVWIAYDKSAAWSKFWLIVAGLVLYAILARIPEPSRMGQRQESLLEWILRSLPTLVTLYFFLTNDWTSRLGKVSWLDPAMHWLASWQPGLVAYRLDANSVGGILAVLIPLQVAVWLKTDTRYRVWGVPFIGLALLGLLLSASRGGWAALAVVTISWAVWQTIARLAQRRGTSSRTAKTTGAIAVALALIAAALFLFITPWGDRLLSLRTDRLELWRNSLDLANDYVFTGLGPANFEMAYSSYALLVHVPYIIHAHNLFLDIWLDQGLLGLLAFGGLLIEAVWPSKSASTWRSAALASLAVLVLHGFLDDAFYGYGGRAIPFLFVPLAVLGRAETEATPLPALVFWGIAAATISISMVLPGARATLQANLGALAQTQAELSIYSNEKWGLQDALRRSPKLDLSRAISHYQTALMLDRTNATANRRMGQIELSRGQYEAACQHLEAAFATAPHQRATRQLLGECYAITGNIPQATALWQTISLNEGQLDTRFGWYYYIGEKDHAARISQAAQGLHR